MAVGIRCIYEPLNLVTGGISGIAILIGHITEGIKEGGIPVWLTTAALNIPLFAAGWFVKGKEYIKRSLYGTVMFTVFLSLIPRVNLADQDYVLAAVIGGLITGCGLGLVFLTSSSTGGTDLLSQIIRRFCPQFSVSTIIFIIDSIIVAAGGVVFGYKNAAYAIAAVYISTRTMDKIIMGSSNGLMLMIISEKYRAISDHIMNEQKRGVTAINVTGMYSNKSKKMLICATGKRELIKTLKIIYEQDINAFIMISDTREILGEGFINMDDYLDQSVQNTQNI